MGDSAGQLRTGDATSLGRTPDGRPLSCQKDRFTERRAQRSACWGTWHLKVRSCRKLVLETNSFLLRCKSFEHQERVEYVIVHQQAKAQTLPHPLDSPKHSVIQPVQDLFKTKLQHFQSILGEILVFFISLSFHHDYMRRIKESYYQVISLSSCKERKIRQN